MAIEVFPVATGSGLTAAQSVTATSPNVLYVSTTSFPVGIYTITCTTTTIARVYFFSGGTFIGLATTVSGSVSFNLATAATDIYFFSNTGSNITINLQKTGEAVSTSAPSGTLDTITESGTFNTTGKMYVMAIGGGGGGNGIRNPGGSGTSGGSGGLSEGFTNTASATTVTVGTGGTGGNQNADGNSGGATSFGNLFVANGGIVAGAGGTPGGASAGGLVTPIGQFAKAGTFGAGEGGGSGIGTGGTRPNPNNGEPTAGNSATGYGAGGGGAGAGGNNSSGNAWQNKPGGAGAPGVVYVLRGF